jgi:tetratricopeptide (TPR) repeat protein
MAFQRALQLDPTLAQAYYYLGLLHSKMNQFSEAIEFFSHAIHYFPQFVKAYEARGDAYLEMGEKQKSKADYQQAAKIEASS